MASLSCKSAGRQADGKESITSSAPKANGQISIEDKEVKEGLGRVDENSIYDRTFIKLWNRSSVFHHIVLTISPPSLLVCCEVIEELRKRHFVFSICGHRSPALRMIFHYRMTDHNRTFWQNNSTPGGFREG